MFTRSYFALAGCAFTLTACAVPPAPPEERDLPVRQIILHATCELRAAFISLKKSSPNFKADQWAAAITLTPKVDTETAARFGYTGKSTTDPKVLRFITWTIGTTPGLEIDIKGHWDGGMSFPVHSSQLLDVKKYPLHGCHDAERASTALS